jgi:predicted nucleotidyltransferase
MLLPIDNYWLRGDPSYFPTSNGDKMRLNSEQINAIKSAVKNIDSNAEVKLFGSCVNNKKHGGDIDLLIDSSIMGWRDVAKLRGILEIKLGEQKIDIIIKSRADPSFIQMIETGALHL